MTTESTWTVETLKQHLEHQIDAVDKRAKEATLTSAALAAAATNASAIVAASATAAAIEVSKQAHLTLQTEINKAAELSQIRFADYDNIGTKIDRKLSGDVFNAFEKKYTIDKQELDKRIGSHESEKDYNKDHKSTLSGHYGLIIGVLSVLALVVVPLAIHFIK